MRRLIALLCVAVIVAALMAPAVSSHSPEVLAPLWVVLFPVLALVVLVPRRDEDAGEQLLSLFSVLSSRAPPRA